MKNSTIDHEIAAAQAWAERLARRARWSVGLGLVGVVPVLLYVMVPRLLYLFSGQYISAEGLVWLVFPAAVAPLIAGIPAVILGVSAARQANTINRPVGVLGLVLGLMSLGACVHRVFMLIYFGFA